MPVTLRQAVAALSLLVMAIFLVRFTGCGSGDDAVASLNSEQQASETDTTRLSIERVLKLDRFTSFDQDSAAPVVFKMRQIDLENCPKDFRAAYVQHIHAWEDMVAWEQEGSMLVGNINSIPSLAEAFVRGIAFDYSSVWEAGDQMEELHQKLINVVEKMRRSFHKVEDVAIQYGAKLPPHRFIEWKGKCTQDGLGEYPMHMKMEVGPRGEVTGTIHWPKLNDSKTSFRGKIQNNRLNFTESELLSSGFGMDWLTGKGVLLPCSYEAQVGAMRMSGTATHKNLTADFTAEVSSGMPEILAEF